MHGRKRGRTRAPAPRPLRAGGGGDGRRRAGLCVRPSGLPGAALRPGHLTGSAWIVSPDRRRTLLTHHRKLDRWLQLGGHADGQADLLAVAAREAKEESGLEPILAAGRPFRLRPPLDPRPRRRARTLALRFSVPVHGRPGGGAGDLLVQIPRLGGARTGPGAQSGGLDRPAARKTRLLP